MVAPLCFFGYQSSSKELGKNRGVVKEQLFVLTDKAAGEDYLHAERRGNYHLYPSDDYITARNHASRETKWDACAEAQSSRSSPNLLADR
jgi:hypothetical protein|tara:strand:+ start:343 stop:612 length:270 start_codon:yes stop_codon:yes gene_type:complete